MASGRKQGASEHLVPQQQKEVRDTDDTAMNSLFDFDDDPIPTQSDQSEVTMMVNVCTKDMKEVNVTPSCPCYKCIRTRINVSSSHPSNESIPADVIVTLSNDDCRDAKQQEAGNVDKREDDGVEANSDETEGVYLVNRNTENTTEDPEHHTLSLQQPEPSSNDATRAYENSITPSCRLKGILSPSTSTPRHIQPLSSNHLMPAPIDHPWILPFAHYNAIDHNIYPLFATEYNDQGGIGRELMVSHGLKCQICYDGSVQCAFKPCGHARTCRSCSNHFIHQPCPFCRQLVLLAYEIHL